jgi:SAC3/GANP family
LAAQPSHNFSQHINECHIDECISEILHLCLEFKSYNSSSSFNLSWLEAEALNVVLSKNSSGLLRALVLPADLKSNKIIQTVIEISTNLCIGNYARAIRLSKQIPLILQLAFHIQLAHLRPFLLKIYEKAYRTSQGTKFPLEKLASYLYLNSADETSDFCQHRSLSVDGSCVIFKAGSVAKSVNNPIEVLIPVPLNHSIEEQLRDVNLSDFLHGEGF